MFLTPTLISHRVMKRKKNKIKPESDMLLTWLISSVVKKESTALKTELVREELVYLYVCTAYRLHFTEATKPF